MEISLQSIAAAFAQMSGWEILAVVLGVAYVILAAKESQWAWPFAFFSTLIYTILFWDGALVSSSVLNFYYMAMAVYGFILWKEDEAGETLNISRWPLKQHLLFISIGLVGSVVLGYLSETYLAARFAYHDAFVMVFLRHCMDDGKKSAGELALLDGHRFYGYGALLQVRIFGNDHTLCTLCHTCILRICFLAKGI